MYFIILITVIKLFLISELYSKVKINKLVKLNDPWSISFIDYNSILVTEKKGKIILYKIQEKILKNIPHNLSIHANGQGGLLDIVYKNNYIWVSYSEKLKNSFSRTSIAKSKFNKEKLIFYNIFESHPPIKSNYHFGSRILLKDGYLYASIGERGKGMIAQDGSKHPGSIIRIFSDGKIPFDNPRFNNKNNWLPEIYQIGVRNPQGLELSPMDNDIYITNHGPMGGDFFGKVHNGGNYGWKILGWGGKNYIGTNIGPKWKPGYNKAIYYWTPSIGVSSFVIYKGNEFPELNGIAIIGSLKYENLYLLNFANLSEVPKINLLVEKKLGRIRDIEIHPENGKIYVINDEYLWSVEKKIN